jgi:hypothetical protein
MLFKTPKNRYPDAVSTIRTYSNFAVTDEGDINLGYSGNANVFAQYKTESQFDSGKDQKTNLAGVWIHAPSKGAYRTYAKIDKTEYTSGTITLEHGSTVTIYGQRKMDGDEDYESATGISVKHKTVGVDGPTSFTPSGEAEAKELTDATTLSFGQGYSISGTYGGTRVGTRKLFKAPSKPTLSMRSKATYPASGNDAHTYYGDDSNNYIINLAYSGEVRVYPEAKQGSDNYSSNNNYVLVKAPANNDATVSGRTYAKKGDTEYTSGTIALGYSDSVTVKGQYKKNDGAWTDAASIKVTSPASDATSHSIDIPSKQIYTSDTARGTKLTTLKSKYETAKADGDYVMFRVDCGDESKWYYMEP